MPGVTVGIGPPARPATVAAAYTLATRALETAVAFGEQGVFSLGDLSIRSAVLADEALGDEFVARYVTPLAGLGRLGTELEDTLRTWFECRMSTDETARALHMHPNTLRHRLRRIADLTGRSPFDLRDRIAFSIALRVADRSSTSSRADGDQPPV